MVFLWVLFMHMSVKFGKRFQDMKKTLTLLFTFAIALQTGAAKPNIVLVFIDDMG